MGNNLCWCVVKRRPSGITKEPGIKQLKKAWSAGEYNNAVMIEWYSDFAVLPRGFHPVSTEIIVCI
jgi:hypothetical protein